MPLLSSKQIPRCFSDKTSQISSKELHGFSDASEKAYPFKYVDGTIQVSLVSSKTKVAPLKELTIPRLELCRAHLLSQLIGHYGTVFNVKCMHIYVGTDSTIVLNRITGEHNHLKSCVGNWVYDILKLTGPKCWCHVCSQDNPANCPLIPLDKFSSYPHLKRVTAWILCFFKNIQLKLKDQPTCSQEYLLV